MMTFKGRLQGARPLLKQFLDENFKVPLKMGPKMAVLGKRV